MARKFNLEALKSKRGIALLLAFANASMLTVDGFGSASAAVIYTDSTVQTAGKTDSAGVDFNLDTLLDAYFTQTTASVKPTKGATAKVTTFEVTGSGDTMLTGGGALLAGTAIDDGLNWSSSVTLGSASKAGSSHTYAGDWLDGSSSGSGYLGFTLSLADGVHYGWLEIVLDAAAGTTAVLGYAYESVADQAIRAGSRVSSAVELPAVPLPAPGLLLIGALAAPLALRRKRRG